MIQVEQGFGLGEQIAAEREARRAAIPVWKGPAHPEGGITFSLLSRYLVCKERFRLLVVEGLKPIDHFNHRLEYGSMWHVCEEVYAGQFGAPSAETGGQPTTESTAAYKPWHQALKTYCQGLTAKYRFDQGEIDKWYNVCRAQFPLYVEHWKQQRDQQNGQTRRPLLQEEAFAVDYELPSGRMIILRGKWDSVELCGHQMVLMENKTKGDIDEEQIKRQLGFDLQTMIYLVALSNTNLEELGASEAHINIDTPYSIRYNVVRRPLSGGEGTIVRHKATAGAKCPKCKGAGRVVVKKGIIKTPEICPKCEGACRIGGKPEETHEHFYDRVAQYIRDNPKHFFMRWDVGVSVADIARFCRECLDPILENLLDDWEWWEYLASEYDGSGHLDVWDWQHRQAHTFPHHYPRHYRHPFGVWNALDEGGSSDFDRYLTDGSEVGLQRTTNLFPELS